MKQNLNLWELLKASRGLPVSDPMARLWGYQYQQKHGVSEISGVPPLRFMSRGGYLQDYRIYGNTVQDGTPTPENPVEVQGCGELTENLFDISSTDGFVSSFTDWSQSIDGKRITVDCSRISGVAHGLSLSLGTLSAGTYNFHIVWNIKPSTVNIRYVSGNTIATITNADTTFSLPEDAEIEVYIVALKMLYTFEDIMLTSGSSAPSEYIPYGYVIPVTVSNGTNSITTPVYIGSEPLHKIDDYADYVDFERGVVVRNIKKIVLTGDENWINNTHNANQDVYRLENFINFRRFPNDAESDIGIYRCDHILYVYPYQSSLFDRIVLSYVYYYQKPIIYFSTKKSMGFDTVTKFKNFLAEQYELGQPVTIWYIADEPEEESLENLLSIQTIKGSDVLTVDTTIQPSNIWIKGKIKAID